VRPALMSIRAISPVQCIRFGHTVPVDAHVDAQIVQDEDARISHTWTNYKFSDFSNVRTANARPAAISQR
jgi:hypothetical protein